MMRPPVQSGIPTSNVPKDGPRKVFMYLYVKAITNVSTKDSTFKLFYHQYLQWYATQAEFDKFQQGDTAEIFVPRILPTNCVEVTSEEDELRGSPTAVHLVKDGEPDIWGEVATFATDDENVEKRPLLGISRKYQVTLSSPMRLQDYPLDVQHLNVFFEAMQTTAHIIFLPSFIYSDTVNLEFGAFASDPDYKFFPPAVEFTAFGDPPSDYACCTVTFKLQRIVRGVLFRIFIPCAMLTLLCFSVFFIPYTDVADRLGVIVTLILALIAFLYVVSENTPPIPYLTLGDQYITSSLGLVSLLTLYVCIAGLNTVVDSVTIDADAGWVSFAIWGAYQLAFCVYARVVLNRANAQIPLSFTELSNLDLLEEQSDSCTVPKAAVKMLYKKKE